LGAHVRYLHERAPVVVGLPRGGVPVAYEVAQALGAPLDVVVVRKLGVPFQPELAMGAIAEGGVRVLVPRIVHAARVTEAELTFAERREGTELLRRSRRYRDGAAPLDLTGRTVVVVDDGLATGATARAAIASVRARGARHVVLAVPVGATESVDLLAQEADEVVCVETHDDFLAVGEWYDDFSATSDDEVVTLLDAARRAVLADDPPEADDDPVEACRDVTISTPGGWLPGTLVVPSDALGVVAFAHGSGSSRFSARNRDVARHLQACGVATLLVDLLSTDEERDRAFVFDVDLLAKRLVDVAAWLCRERDVQGLPIGYFGASTGAAAALAAAADAPETVRAVVSRGGRPDLAWDRLPDVRAPTLLIVGGADQVVAELNRDAAGRLRCIHRVDVVRGATHLFEEPGALEEVASLAATWFARWFTEV
jgi:putative phosphoribosyl transferase